MVAVPLRFRSTITISREVKRRDDGRAAQAESGSAVGGVHRPPGEIIPCEEKEVPEVPERVSKDLDEFACSDRLGFIGGGTVHRRSHLERQNVTQQRLKTVSIQSGKAGLVRNATSSDVLCAAGRLKFHTRREAPF
jgi:hypothetical protein